MPNALLSFGVKGPTQDWTVEVAISEANSARILGYLLGGTSYGTVTEGDITRRATPEEAARGFALGILRGLLDQTTSHERDVASAAAAAAIAPIDPE